MNKDNIIDSYKDVINSFILLPEHVTMLAELV